MLIPHNLKAAALYVNFYQEITLAWKKYQLPHIEEETAVSTVIQYLIKNVDIIENDKRRYTPNYIYQLAKNAIYPLGRIQCNIEYYRRRCSWYDSDDAIFTLWTLGDMGDNNFEPWCSEKVVDNTDVLDQVIERGYSDAFWEVVRNLNDEESDLIDRIVNGRTIGKRLKQREPEILATLRIKFEKFQK